MYDATERSIERVVVRKLLIRLVCFAGLLYFFNWLDRVNVGFAALQMNEELHFSATIYGLGAGIFFFAFAVFEVPSNLILHRVGARIWIARIMITWGLICAACALIQGEWSFYTLRFLLGAAEAGFTPGLVLYFSLWFPVRHRAKAFGLLFASPLLAPVIGGPLSGWLLTATAGIGGLAGWQWMFIAEGLPAAILGFVVLVYLKDGIDQAGWLTGPEREWLKATLAEEHRLAPPKAHESVTSFLGDGRLWALVAIYFFWSMSGYAIVLWLPLLIKSVTNLSPVMIGFLNSVPFLFAIAGLLIVGRHSDRTGERKHHIALFAVLTFFALLGTAMVGSAWAGYALLCASAFCIWAQQAVFWTLPSSYLSGRSAAGGIALVNMGAGIGGFIGPPTVGFIRDATGGYAGGLAALSLTSLAVTAIVMSMRLDRAPRALETPAELAV